MYLTNSQFKSIKMFYLPHDQIYMDYLKISRILRYFNRKLFSSVPENYNPSHCNLSLHICMKEGGLL